jgi:hypothetical protein
MTGIQMAAEMAVAVVAVQRPGQLPRVRGQQLALELATALGLTRTVRTA